MGKFIRWALALGLCASLLVCGAAAAQESGVAVQLDGRELSFSDAAPQVRDERVFLPFRAVLEAMGAQVENDGNVITAVRGPKTLTMTIGSTQAAVAEGDRTTAITMDVAPYVDPATWRTYVPVRFAAQAFNCVVGWDQERFTAIIVDTEKLLDQAAQGKSFTYLQQLMELSRRYDTGIWDVDATFEANLLGLITMDGDIRGTVQDSSQVDMDMDLRMDLSALPYLTGSEFSEAEQAGLDALAQQGIGISARGDMADGKLYINMDLSALGDLADEITLPADAWLEMDAAAMMEEAGLDMSWDQLLGMSQDVDFASALPALLCRGLTLNDAANDYAAIQTVVNDCFAAFSDAGFVQTGNTYTTSYLLPDELTGIVALTLEMDEDGALDKYLVRTTFSSSDTDLSILSLSVSADRAGRMQVDMTTNVNGQPLLDLTFTGSYTPGSAAPRTTPPDGAAIVPLVGSAGLL